MQEVFGSGTAVVCREIATALVFSLPFAAFFTVLNGLLSLPAVTNAVATIEPVEAVAFPAADGTVEVCPVARMYDGSSLAEFVLTGIQDIQVGAAHCLSYRKDRSEISTSLLPVFGHPWLGQVCQQSLT